MKVKTNCKAGICPLGYHEEKIKGKTYCMPN